VKESMKHRLVGTAVLVALGIIAWPVIFDTTPVREINRRSQIPEAPEVDRFSVPEPGEVHLPPAPDSAALRESADVGPPRPGADAAPAGTEAGGEAADAAPAGPTPGDAAPAAEPSAPQARAPAAPDDKPVAPAGGDAFGLPEQWALQLGVFGQLENAIEVRQRAEKAGYHAILQSSGGKHRVYVAPKLDKRAVERLAPEVERKLGIKGYVTRYYP
jgi:DedD protein